MRSTADAVNRGHNGVKVRFYIDNGPINPGILNNKAYLVCFITSGSAPVWHWPHLPCAQKGSMKKDTIVQFVGYITALDADAFAASWAQFAGPYTRHNIKTTLQQQAGTKARYKYISQHLAELSSEGPEAFVGKKRSDHLPVHTVKPVPVGGYIPQEATGKSNKKGVKVVAFVGHEENDFEFYRQSGLHLSVTVYQAYYQSCTYACVFEYTVDPSNCEALVRYLKARPGNEVAAYIDCPVPAIL
jgi:hypothetical protein